jgi:hypothetical protein
MYLREIGQIDLLNATQEMEFSSKVQQGLMAEEKLKAVKKGKKVDCSDVEIQQLEEDVEMGMQARDILIQSIATGIGLSVSTLASYVSDGSNRTAREVSAEESATTLFVENMRRRFEVPINDMLRDVLRFYGFVDDVEIRWTRAGMTNQTILVDTLAKAVEAGLISQKKAHHAFNFDDDEEQNDEDYALVLKERKEREPQGFDMPFESEGFADILDSNGGDINEDSSGQAE